jgi:hypothetical protein
MSRVAAILAAVIGTAAGAAVADAATFSVNPTQIYLSGKNGSGVRAHPAGTGRRRRELRTRPAGRRLIQ